MKKLTANPKPETIQWKIWGSFWLHANNSLKKKSAGANAKPNAVDARRYNNDIRWTGKSPNQSVQDAFGRRVFRIILCKGSWFVMIIHIFRYLIFLWWLELVLDFYSNRANQGSLN